MTLTYQIANRCLLFQAFAAAEDGQTPRTSATVTPAAIHVSSLSTAESTRQTWHMSPTCWPRRMLLCVPLWCAVTSLSMEACSPATALCRACRRPTAAAVVERAATVRLETATDTADDQDTTLAAAPLRHSSEILDASSSVWGVMRGRWRFFLRRPKLFLQYQAVGSYVKRPCS